MLKHLNKEKSLCDNKKYHWSYRYIYLIQNDLCEPLRVW